MLLFFLLIFQSTYGQIIVSPKEVNYGVLTAETDKVVDILIENKGTQKDLLLRTTFSHEFEVRYTAKELLPGKSIVVRIKFNPREKGNFLEKAELWFANSNTPIIVPIKANVQYVNVNENNPCPDFSQRVAECCSNNGFILDVLDADTNSPIEKASVRILQETYVQKTLSTSTEGKIAQEVPIGFYTIEASKKGYNSNSVTSYINKQHNRFIIRLKRDPRFIEETPVATEVKKDTLTVNTFSPSELLPADQFAPNNIVFLLDISGSMGVGDKLALLQLSLQKLTEVLRPIDKVAIISYAGEAHVLLSSTTGSEKDSIQSIISGLKAQGKTSGAAAFKKAYREIATNRIDEGNNQLIVITDGVFQSSDQLTIEKLVKKAHRKKIKTSVVAIESNGLAHQKLSLVSELGNGSFLPIENENDARTILINELKKQSAK